MNTKLKLERKIRNLEKELMSLKHQLNDEIKGPQTVYVPEEFEDLFASIEKKVREYFTDFHIDPDSGEITVYGERYVLFRSASVSYEFLQFIKDRYSDRDRKEAVSIGNNFLYDNSKVIGKKDAIAFHRRMNLVSPIEKLSAGPVHFAFTGWANVEISSESNPSPDENYILKFKHQNSFEAQSWIKEGKVSDIPVCTMNCGYSAGWCEESYDMPLTTVEITCEAKGDDCCSFIMAPTDKIESLVEKEIDLNSVQDFDIPVFFKRKFAEEKLKQSVEQKVVLIQEIHHRVKNNLQVVMSLLRLQMNKINNEDTREEFAATINRINTMATVHELMYQEKDFEQLDLGVYFTKLMKSLVQLYSINNEIDVTVEANIKNASFNLDASIPLALIMNEITCNAFKHGLVKGGKFYSSLSQIDNRFELIIGDDGGGFEKTMNHSGLGMSLIEVLCEQLDADLKIQNNKIGLEYKITFSLPD
jgi:two-component sensor histidine kinase/predicted hydrocarbon binding protein